MNKESSIGIISNKNIISINLYNFLIKKKHKKIFFFDASDKKNKLNFDKKLEKFFIKNKINYVFLSHAESGGISYNISNPADLIMSNINLSISTVKFSHKYKVKKLCNIASSCMYPANIKQPLKEEYLMSGKLENTNQAFAIAKLASYYLCDSFNKQFKTNFITVIPTNYYGPSDKFDVNNSHVISSLIMKLDFAKKNKKNDVEIWGSGKPLREFIYIEDLINGIYFSMKNYNDTKPLNIAGGKIITIKNLAIKLAKIIKYNGKLKFNKNYPDGMFKKYLDSSMIKKLGWKPHFNLDQGLKSTFEWYQKKS